MGKFNRLNRELGKAMLAGAGGGVASRSITLSFTGGVRDSVLITLLYLLMLFGFYVYEKTYPPEDDDKEEDSNESPYQDISYAS